MKINIKKLVGLYTLTLLGFFLGLWLSPQLPITSFLPTESESSAFKEAVWFLAFITGVITSIFSLIGSHYLKLKYVYSVIAICLTGLLFNSFDLIRFGELTINNLVWLGVFLIGFLLIFILIKMVKMVKNNKTKMRN